MLLLFYIWFILKFVYTFTFIFTPAWVLILWFVFIFGAHVFGIKHEAYSVKSVFVFKSIFLFFLFKKLGFVTTLLIYLNSYFLETLLTILIILIPVAAFSLLDRKLMALVQRRKGPSLVGSLGSLQFIVDGIKLLFKEVILPYKASRRWYFVAPIMTMLLSFLGWMLMPTHPTLSFSYVHLDLLVILLLSSLNVYTTVLAGWSSNSRYAFLGSLRAIAQLIAYEIPMFFSLMPIFAFVGSVNIKVIVFSQKGMFFVFPFFPAALIFFICIVAETNRAPFDLPEAESELVAGFNTEYSSLIFAFFFIAEYTNMLLMSALWVNLFWGGWLPFFSFLDFIPSNINFSIKLCTVSFVFVFIRANLPRYRYDQFMDFGWKVLLPTTFLYFSLIIPFIVFLNA